MVGQKALLNTIDMQIKNKTFPKFSIIVGESGSGKHTLVKHIHKTFGKGLLAEYGPSVSDVRNAIEKAYTVQGDLLFCVFYDADRMSMAAKNAMLKVVEEPPENVYFILTLESLSNTLDTIKSRGQVYNMQPYTPTEIGEYASQYKLNSGEMGIVANLCEVPGEVNDVYSYGIIAFDEYVKTVVDNIDLVSGANCFKIGNKLAFKDEDSGYGIKLFLKAFICECNNRLIEDVVRYAYGIKVTSKYLQDLRINGISKSNLIDMWILDIRKEWMA